MVTPCRASAQPRTYYYGRQLTLYLVFQSQASYRVMTHSTEKDQCGSENVELFCILGRQ